ncbi:MAG: chloride channel protein [Neomegalonema sp.]
MSTSNRYRTLRRKAWVIRIRPILERAMSMEQPYLWVIAIIVGSLSACAAGVFVETLNFLALTFYGATEETLYERAAALPWWVLLLTPVLGGVSVGLITKHLGGHDSPIGVAEVIEARALQQGQVDLRQSSASVLAASVSLGMGASAGREGPAVLAGATISSLVSRYLKLAPHDARTVMGCAVAAAVSASFNAPLAGALFALEVVLGHYAVRAFAPITIASVAGAVISRSYFGDEAAFAIPSVAFGSYAQFPAFFLLGLLSAGVAGLMMWSIFLARDVIDGVREAAKVPVWLQPAMAGFLLGCTALVFPNVIGVGYQTTSLALAGAFGFWTCVLYAVAKCFATAVTLGGRFAGGVFSPALVLGALTGSAYGAVATDIFPSGAGSQELYALAGMGAVAGAVLGAPVSTTLIAFELTGDYGTAIAVMVSTSVATVATQQTVNKSFFHWQLHRRDIDLAAGPQHFLLPTMKVSLYLRPRGAENGASDTAAWALVEQGVSLRADDTLEDAFPLFRNGALAFVPVVGEIEEGAGDTLIGALFYTDALRAYNRALVDAHEEEHS